MLQQKQDEVLELAYTQRSEVLKKQKKKTREYVN